MMKQSFKAIFLIFLSVFLGSLAIPGLASHIHHLEERLTQEPALTDLHYDILVVSMVDMTRVRVDEVLRGGQSLGETAALFQKMSSNRFASVPGAETFMKPVETLKPGDQIIVFAIAGDPLLIDSGSIYEFRKGTRYRILQRMTPATRWWLLWLIGIVFLFPAILIALLYALKWKLLPEHQHQQLIALLTPLMNILFTVYGFLSRQYTKLRNDVPSR